MIRKPINRQDLLVAAFGFSLSVILALMFLATLELFGTWCDYRYREQSRLFELQSQKLDEVHREVQQKIESRERELEKRIEELNTRIADQERLLERIDREIEKLEDEPD